MPTDTSTDLIGRAHDRAFVVAGVRDDALLADFQQAIDDALAKGLPFKGYRDKQGRYHEGFRDRFDKLVAKHGWDHSMSADRRAKVIYDTNLKTARTAGRIRQARNPAVMKVFPYWMYIHGFSGDPVNPRPDHESWDSLVLLADDPFWDTHMPPNGYFCSCGFRTISKAKLKRLGKTGPDPSPPVLMKPQLDPRTGMLVEVPQGIQFGFDYQPGADWSHGLVPRAISGKPGDHLQLELPTPKPPSLTDGRAFKAKLLDNKVSDVAATAMFMRAFGTTPDQPRRFRDKAGYAIPISPQLFRRADGKSKLNSSRKTHILLTAEAIREPDEIWVSWEKNLETGRWALVRYYLRLGDGIPVFSVFRYGIDGWSAITAYPPLSRGKYNQRYLDRFRKGRLIYKRGDEEK